MVINDVKDCQGVCVCVYFINYVVVVVAVVVVVGGAGGGPQINSTAGAHKTLRKTLERKPRKPATKKAFGRNHPLRVEFSKLPMSCGLEPVRCSHAVGESQRTPAPDGGARSWFRRTPVSKLGRSW